jgi:hypothetical protein
MSMLINTTVEFPVSIELGKADISRTAAEAAHLSFHPNQHARLDRIKRLGAAMITEMEKLRETPHAVLVDDMLVTAPHPAAREASVAITQLQTAIFWCASAVICTIKE